MEIKDILVIVLCLLAFGFSLYRKYAKKNQAGAHYQKNDKPGSSFSSVKDDYEPYSKK